MNTETRILYDEFADGSELRYVPHGTVTPWETWTDGKRIFAGAAPQDLLDDVDDTEFEESDGNLLHERHPERCSVCEVVAADYPLPAMDLAVVPSVDVQKAVWNALKSTTDEYESVDLYELCDERAIDLDEAERAAKLLMIQGFVEYASVDLFPFLTPEGRECDQPKWIHGSRNDRNQQETRDQ